MKRLIVIALALPLALTTACSAPKEAEGPANTASADSNETGETIKQEAKSIEAAANEAAALIEAEANAEIKAMDGDADGDAGAE